MGGVASPPATFRENVKINLARGLREVFPVEPREDALYICCAGPSLRETAHETEGKKYVWALNGAHDYLIGRGLVPSHGVAQAPEVGILDNFKKAGAGVTYLFASCTNPELVDRTIAQGGRVILWHSHCPEEWGVDYSSSDTTHYMTMGGGTVGLRAIDLAYMVGFREVHCLGFDACISDDGRIGPDLLLYEDRKQDVRIFLHNGRAFRALPSYARQVEDYGITVRPLTGLNLTFYGDGLMQWAVKGMQSNEVR